MGIREKEKHRREKEQMRAAAEEAVKSLRESEEKFRTLADTAAMAIFIHQGGNFLYANRAAELIGGYRVDEYLSLNFMSLVHPDYADLVKTRARERLGGGNEVPSQYEFKILRKNGEERWVLMTGGVTKFEGKPAVIGTLIDITARKRAEEERERYYRELQKATQSLKESEARFRTLTETTTAAIVIHRGGAASLHQSGRSKGHRLHPRRVPPHGVLGGRSPGLQGIGAGAGTGAPSGKTAPAGI
jgi:PAS domain S-box-containing protein